MSSCRPTPCRARSGAKSRPRRRGTLCRPTSPTCGGRSATTASRAGPPATSCGSIPRARRRTVRHARQRREEGARHRPALAVTRSTTRWALARTGARRRRDDGALAAAEAARLDELRLDARGADRRAPGERRAGASDRRARGPRRAPPAAGAPLGSADARALPRGTPGRGARRVSARAEILADELGIDPSPELARLHERILKQDPGLELRGEPLRGYRLLEKIDEGPTGTRLPGDPATRRARRGDQDLPRAARARPGVRATLRAGGPGRRRRSSIPTSSRSTTTGESPAGPTSSRATCEVAAFERLEERGEPLGRGPRARASSSRSRPRSRSRTAKASPTAT